MSVDLLAGIDISSVRLDAALIPRDPLVDSPVLLRHFELRKAGGIIERLRIMRGVIKLLLDNPYGDVLEVALEQPMGPSDRMNSAIPLNQVLGALTAAMPTRIENVGWMTAQKWRGVLGATNQNSKPAGHDVVRPIAARMPIHHGLNEHQLDALGLALAYRQLRQTHHNRKAA